MIHLTILKSTFIAWEEPLGLVSKGKLFYFCCPQRCLVLHFMSSNFSKLGFKNYLKAAKIPLNEYEFPQKKLANVQSQVLFVAMSAVDHGS